MQLQRHAHTLLSKLVFSKSCTNTCRVSHVSQNLNMPKFKSSSNTATHFSPSRVNHTHRLVVLLTQFAAKPFRIFLSFALKTNGYSSVSRPNIPGPVHLESSEERSSVAREASVLKKKLEELGFESEACVPGQRLDLQCPKCLGGNSKERSLTLFIASNWSSAYWLCSGAKCGWKGSTKAFADCKSSYRVFNEVSKVKKIREHDEESLQLEPLCNELLDYFSKHLISAETLHRNGVKQKVVMDQVMIAFPYRRNKELISCKYRGVTKRFWQEADTEKIFYGLDDRVGESDTIIEADTEKIFYGLDDIEEESDIIIVEGEMDKLALEEAGFRNCVSVPDGAPARFSKNEVPPEEQDTKYQYLWNCKEYLEQASRIILATDGDTPGQALAEELARRLGRERCWQVTWPKRNGVKNDELPYYKDANEVLINLGPGALREVIENAELYPIRGLYYFKDYFDEIDAYYNQSLRHGFGVVSTGWSNLRELYNVVPGELTIVTGVPNSGKSEWIDALLCNLNESVGWKFALCSMENKVREHARKLLEKHIKKPFFNVRYGECAERMSVQELEQGKEWLSRSFYLIRCEDDCLPNIKWLLDLARAAVLWHGVRGLVIDPYNELDHQRPPSLTETEYVSQVLTRIKRFAQHHGCHVWLVAHPRQLQNWLGGPPNLYDISGSAHFVNKCDNGIVIHRNRTPEAGPIDQVQVCVRKVRNKIAGTIGEAFLSYNRVTGEFSDIDITSDRR